MWLHIQNGYRKEEVIAKLKAATAKLRWPPTKNKKRKKLIPKVSFAEFLARAVPEQGGHTMEDPNKTGVPTPEAPNTTEGETGNKPARPKYQGSPADDPVWVKRAVEAFLKATAGEKVIKANLLGKFLGREVDRWSSRTVKALVNRGYLVRVHAHGDPKKAVVAYEVTDKALALVRGVEPEKDDATKRRLERLAKLEEKARPILELEKELVVAEDEISRLECELPAAMYVAEKIKKRLSEQEDEAKQARELLRVLDGKDDKS
jgi:DNA-binding Lrp family transcriptional regulator